MNEQRQQDYLNLIQSLLNCRSHDEVREILAANQELVDVGFLQTVEAVGEMFSQQGDESTANWLQGLAMQLGEALNLDTKVDLQSLSEEEIQAYFQFLMDVLQATAESRGNAQVVYSLLANNTDKLDGVLAEILSRSGTNTLEKAQANQAESIAANIFLFSDLIQQFPLGKKASNMEIAIIGYKVALTVYTSEAFSQEWATIQNCLGIAYVERITGEKAENIELAIAAYTAALSIYTQQAFPQNWARTQYNLGNAYRERITGEKAENIELAIAAFSAALSVLTQQAFPQYHAQTLWNLGITYQDTNQLTLAYTTFESAIATVESLREEIVSGQESKRKQAEEWNKLYSRMVEVCLELKNITQAIEYVERSKTRNLVEQILTRDSKTFFPADAVTQLEKYRDEIAIGQYQIQNGKAENPKVLAQHLHELRQQRNKLQDRYLPVGYGFKFDSFQATLNERTAIIEWYILNDKILAFIVTPTGEVTDWQSQLEDREAFGDWVNQYLQNYYNQKDQWQNSLGEKLKKLASILHIDEILTQIPNHCDQLILIPHQFLHLFPLHALPVNQNSENSRCLVDSFPRGVSYAPSCQILQEVQKRQRPDFQSVFAIQNPTEDLNYTDLEVEIIQSYFNTSNVLKKTAATLTAINNGEIFRFGSVGLYKSQERKLFFPNPHSPFSRLANQRHSGYFVILSRRKCV